MGTRTNVFGVQIRTFLELPFSLREMAGATGLEPATYGVTGRHSNQLSYAPAGQRSKSSETWHVSASAKRVKAGLQFQRGNLSATFFLYTDRASGNPKFTA